MPGNSFDRYSRRLPDAAQLLIALAFIAFLTAFKLAIGQSVPLIDFLFIPVVWVGWFARRRWLGHVVAVIAAVDTVVIAMVAETQASAGAALGSGVARLALYLVVLALLGMMRRERAGHQWEASTDELTGAANARRFDLVATQEVERAQRYGHELSLAFLDVDDFKHINDSLGHTEGDSVLAHLGHVLRSTVRSTDTVARIGGDEFAVLMPETSAAAAAAVMERVRDQLARLELSDHRRVGFSIGLVTFDRAPGSVGEMRVAADELLYRAKLAGKDRIERAERAGSYMAAPAGGRASVSLHASRRA
jgi:diguanylate cyclase (GGDEF)-like protein